MRFRHEGEFSRGNGGELHVHQEDPPWAPTAEERRRTTNLARGMGRGDHKPSQDAFEHCKYYKSSVHRADGEMGNNEDRCQNKEKHR